MDTNDGGNDRKPHRERRAGRKAEKRKKNHVQDLTAQQRNPKAFAFNSVVKTQRKFARTEDIKSRKQHIPVVNRAPLEPPPVLVAVVGGCKVGKSTLVRGLIKNYTKQKLSTIEGPITVVAGKRQRLTIVEVKNDINCMIDIAKIADVVLMLIDITLGIEMEIFEFLEICRAYGTPRVMGVLNHLDLMKNNKGLKKRKKELIHRFQVELYPGAKLFYLTGILHGEYFKTEVSKLGRFISVLKFRPLQFRSTHPYVLVDRMEDITNVETIRQNPVCSRNVVVYGYVRGVPMQPGQSVHIPGVGDCCIKDISLLDDPCPFPHTLKKRSLNSKERLIYAPMSGVAGIVYDKDAIYIDLGGSHHGRHRPSKVDDEDEDEVEIGRGMMDSLLQLQKTTDKKTAESNFRLFSHSQPASHIDEDDSEEEEDEKDLSRNGDEEETSNPNFEAIVDGDGRVRRRVIFEDTHQDSESGIESDDESDNDSDQELDSEDDEREDNQPPRKKFKKNERPVSNENKFHSPSGVDQESDELKSNLPGIVKSSAMSTKSYISYLANSIYGTALNTAVQEENEQDSDDDDDDGLFKKATKLIGKKSSSLSAGADLNGVDSAKRHTKLRNWSDSETLESIRNCFTTGDWGVHSAEKLLQLDEEVEDDAECLGDFEDLETGQKFEVPKSQPKTSEDGGTQPTEKDNAERSKREKLIEKKRKLKEFFNAEYDDKGNEDHFDNLKAEMNEQADLNRNQFKDLDDETRVLYEGFRAGLYVRMEFEEMHSELVTNFDATYPLIIGGLLDNEQSMGYVNVRFKVHRWFPRILKNGDPLYLSLGWRRFQSMVFYAKREDNFRLRSLKYARKYMHVEAIFWGPISEVSSGFVAIQNINERTPDFSIAANGVVLESDQSTKIVKKLKLIGYPEKIYQKTAFIKDMFHSETEAVKFEGVKIQTQSSIRGLVKKTVGLEGLFRATFEDQIKMSDTVFLTTWVSIDVPKFYTVLKNLLLPPGTKSKWNGLKTTGQIKRENKIRNLANPDSLYTEITERREYVHLPLTIPKQLQKALPYKDKPKTKIAAKKQQRVVVVKDPEEVKMEEFMKRLRVMMKDKIIKKQNEKAKHHKTYKAELRQKEGMRKMREKKKKAFSCKNKSVKKRKT